MDPDGRWTATRAVLLAAAGQNCWPPAGSYMAADSPTDAGDVGYPSNRALQNFPVCAGMTRGTRSIRSRRPELPRIRGDDGSGFRSARPPTRISPYTRG